MTARLVRLMLDRWEVMDGFALAHGIEELARVPIGRLTSFIYWRLVDGAEPAEVEKFRARLWQPPRGIEADPRSPWSSENEQASFGAAIASLTGRVPDSA